MLRALFFLSLLPSLLLAPRAHAEELSVRLRADAAALDRLTGTVETANHVTLLHLGRRSWPKRLELLRNARKFVFVSVPYWYGDRYGTALADAFEEKISATPGLDVRILEDWTSPGSTGDFFGLKMFRRLRELTGGNAILWNTPWWGRRFSFKLIKNRLHDKLFVVDGRQLLMGGMNVGDTYLGGGSGRKGWHDTDVLIEGPAAAVAGRLFVKTWEFARYAADGDNRLPRGKETSRQALENYFYNDAEVYEYARRNAFGHRTHLRMRIPYSGQLEALGLEGPNVTQAPVDGVPVRLVYDNPLFNQEVAKGRTPYCRFQCVMDFLFQRTQRTVRMFAPYLTITEHQEQLLADTARRGVRVELITNSLRSNDIGAVGYYAAVSHYLALLEAGVRIYEWQGHQPLEALEKKYGCRIPETEFPGKTIHTKSLVLDRQVGVVGSNNMNVRSENYNSEVMAVVNDERFAADLDAVFEHDFDRDPAARTVRCGSRVLPRPPLVREVDLPSAREFVRKHKVLIWLARRLQALI